MDMEYVAGQKGILQKNSIFYLLAVKVKTGCLGEAFLTK